MWTERHHDIVSGLISGLTQEELVRSHSVRLGALPIGGCLHLDCYLRPNGEVIIVDEDTNQPEGDMFFTDRSSVIRMLLSGSRRYPALLELIPERPPTASECRCLHLPIFGRLPLTEERKTLCPECGGLGWVQIDHVYSDWFKAQTE